MLKTLNTLKFNISRKSFKELFYIITQLLEAYGIGISKQSIPNNEKGEVVGYCLTKNPKIFDGRQKPKSNPKTTTAPKKIAVAKNSIQSEISPLVRAKIIFTSTWSSYSKNELIKKLIQEQLGTTSEEIRRTVQECLGSVEFPNESTAQSLSFNVSKEFHNFLIQICEKSGITFSQLIEILGSFIPEFKNVEQYIKQP